MSTEKTSTIPAAKTAPAAMAPAERLVAAAATVAEAHKCRINVHFNEHGDSTRLVITDPATYADFASAMGIALDVCSEANHQYAVASVFGGYDGMTVWLRPTAAAAAGVADPVKAKDA